MGTTEEPQMIDYVLVYEKSDPDCGKRLEFLREVKRAGLSLHPDLIDDDGAAKSKDVMENDDYKQKEHGDKNQIIKIYAPFKILSQAAEKMRLKMPLDIKSADTPATGLAYLLKYLETDNEDDYFSAPYRHDKQHLFKGIDKKTTFFRPAVRSLIVNSIFCCPDKFLVVVLTTCAPELAAPLAKLFQYNYTTFIYLTMWEISQVCPVHKKRDKPNMAGYHLISLLSIISKVMEGIVNSDIKQHLLTNNLLTDVQFGFRQDHLAPELITGLVQTWTLAEVQSGGEISLQQQYKMGDNELAAHFIPPLIFFTIDVNGKENRAWCKTGCRFIIARFVLLPEVHHILNDIQMPFENQKEKGGPKEDTEMCSFFQSGNTEEGTPFTHPVILVVTTATKGSYRAPYSAQTQEWKYVVEDGKVKKIPTLPYLLMKKVFKSAFTLHEGPKNKSEGEPSASSTQENGDPHNKWMDLNNLWARTYGFQPLWKIRNYFGEKIAFYFAVMETLLISLIIPAIIGLAIFIYGLYYSVSCKNVSSDVNTFLRGYNCSIVCSTPNMVSEVADKAVDQIRGICDNVAGRKKNIEQILNRTCAVEVHSDCVFQVPLDDVFNVIKSSFDNAATPLFGLIICLWGTIFLEKWKRKNAELVYEWDVENYENDELTRPEFYGTEPDPITGEPESFYPVSRQRLKFLLSLTVGIVLVGCVFISVLAVVIYKTWARARVTTSNSFESFLLTTIVSSLLNALSIAILNKVYQIIAVKMTDWENYRTQTDYNDALIIKLFAFQFANSYSSLFYIAFLRTNNEQFFTSIGLPGLEDNCGELNNCMSELSFQVLTLMITKPLPKFLKDVIAPWLKKLMNRCCSDKNKELFLQKDCSTVDEYILTEYSKPDLGDFTLEEYTEKVIQYGYQMLFAVSFPLGPFFFFLTILFDIHVDAKRLLWMYKRPIAHMAQDIGHWFTILDLINGVAVVTNGCLIAFTAEFGREKPFYEKLAILIVFEHIVFVVKFLLSTLIPDVPQLIHLAIRREKYEAQKKMEADCCSSL
ncbi:anoctamin-7-like [Heptranchias perlo]|uniref:anoctamin-7-like n=1 Tax=Heptranchias perlo TaxID=212740 RepID=UPI00355ABA82